MSFWKNAYCKDVATGVELFKDNIDSRAWPGAFDCKILPLLRQDWQHSLQRHESQEL